MVIFDDKKFSVYYNDSKKEEFDVVISTLPTPVLVQVAGEVFPDDYVRRLRKVKYLAAANFIIQTDRPLIKDYYWLNISTDKIPFMVFVQHTNMIDKKYYGGKHLAYIGNYFDISSSPLASFNKKNAYDYFLPYLDKIKDENNKIDIKKSYWFSTPYAQPIYDKEFVQSKPDFRTPVKNFYVANLDMTYPYDRGTNYAVKLGRQVAELIN
jgi:protoporphyrinogen oxidase